MQHRLRVVVVDRAGNRTASSGRFTVVAKSRDETVSRKKRIRARRKALKQRLMEVPETEPLDVEKVELLFRLRHLLLRKYALSHDHLLDQLQAFEHLNSSQVRELERAMAAQRHEASLEILLGMPTAIWRLW